MVDGPTFSEECLAPGKYDVETDERVKAKPRRKMEKKKGGVSLDQLGPFVDMDAIRFLDEVRRIEDDRYGCDVHDVYRSVRIDVISRIVTGLTNTAAIVR
jgi:hypothetical protein